MPWHIIILYAAIAIILDFTVNTLLTNEYRAEQKIIVTQEIGILRARIEENIDTNLFIVYGMAAHISLHSKIEDTEFKALAEVLLSQSDDLKNIAIAPDFVISNVFPLEQNRAIIGLNYREIPEQWEQAKAAFETGSMAVAGPIDLVQGGSGLVARIPVFTHGTDKFWGLVSSVMDFRTLLKKSGYTDYKKDLNIAIRGKDGKGSSGDVFMGDPELFTEKRDSISMSINLPSGTWQMAAEPIKGWIISNPHSNIVHTIMIFIFLSAAASAALRYRAKQDLMESENMLKSMSLASHDALIMMDEKGNITFWNPAAEKMFGYTEKEVLGKDMHKLLTLPEDKQKARIGMSYFMRTGTGPVINTVMEMTAVRKDGEIFPIERSVSPFKIKGKWYAVGSVRDITKRKQNEKQLIAMATTDPLTGIPNRRHFMDQADRHLKLAIRHKEPFSVLMFDLDLFKKINDTYGHETGDAVLKKVAASISECMRNTDIIGRIGGEEFAIALPNTGAEAAFTSAERLRIAIMEQKVEAEGIDVTFTASMGISELDNENQTLEDLLKQADEALYTSKNNGRNQVSRLNGP